MNLQDMTNEQLYFEIIGVSRENAEKWYAVYRELYLRFCAAKRLYDVYDVRIKSKQPEFTWDMIYPIPVRGESKRHAAQSTKNTHLLAIQTDAVIMVTERGMNTVTGEVFTMDQLD